MSFRTLLLSLALIGCRPATYNGQITVPGESDVYWYDKALTSIQRAERMDAEAKGRRYRPTSQKIQPLAKNVIIFVGDGMGLPTVAASRILKGQRMNKTGEETYLSWENFPKTAFSRTYNTDHQIPDSAGTATAILCGVKTKMGVIGVNDSIVFQGCDSVASSRIRCIADWFISKGKSAGVVTNTRITHATPGSLYANAPDRNLEGQKDFVSNKVNRSEELTAKGLCMDIAWQLVSQYPGNALKVIMGGGWRKFLLESQSFKNLKEHSRGPGDTNTTLWAPKLENKTVFGSPDSGTSKLRKKRVVFLHPVVIEAGKIASGERKDEDLVDKWIKTREGRNESHKFVTDKFELNAVNANETDYLMGLFAHDHMTYGLKRKPGHGDEEPTLVDMVMKAMDVLEKDPNGYFLLVEGGRIDHAHHEGRARLALEETVAMDEAVAKVAERIGTKSYSSIKDGPQDTLLIVTADHSHVFNMGGYPLRGNPILGLNREYSSKEYELSDVDNLPYTTLFYGNGPGGLDPKKAKIREDVRTVDTTDPDYLAQAAIPLTEETHGGDDVPVYAIGPGSHLIYGVQEENYIAHAMAYSACVGPYEKTCRNKKDV